MRCAGARISAPAKRCRWRRRPNAFATESTTVTAAFAVVVGGACGLRRRLRRGRKLFGDPSAAGPRRVVSLQPRGASAATRAARLDFSDAIADEASMEHVRARRVAAARRGDRRNRRRRPVARRCGGNARSGRPPAGVAAAARALRRHDRSLGRTARCRSSPPMAAPPAQAYARPFTAQAATPEHRHRHWRPRLQRHAPPRKRSTNCRRK